MHAAVNCNCNLLYDVYFEGYDKTYHLAFTKNYSEKQSHNKIFFKPFSEKKATGCLSFRVRVPLNDMQM